MSEITMIGLGAMGSALARALLKSGHELTVWNRTAQKMAPLVDLGQGPGSVRRWARPEGSAKTDSERPVSLRNHAQIPLQT